MGVSIVVDGFVACTPHKYHCRLLHGLTGTDSSQKSKRVSSALGTTREPRYPCYGVEPI